MSGSSKNMHLVAMEQSLVEQHAECERQLGKDHGLTRSLEAQLCQLRSNLDNSDSLLSATPTVELPTNVKAPESPVHSDCRGEASPSRSVWRKVSWFLVVALFALLLRYGYVYLRDTWGLSDSLRRAEDQFSRQWERSVMTCQYSGRMITGRIRAMSSPISASTARTMAASAVGIIADSADVSSRWSVTIIVIDLRGKEQEFEFGSQSD